MKNYKEYLEALGVPVEPLAIASESVNLLTGETRRFLSLAWQKAWFRAAYKAGRISVSILRETETEVYAEAKVYASTADPVEAYLANGYGRAGISDGFDMLSLAISKALRSALDNAGFQIPSAVPGEDETDLTGITPPPPIPPQPPSPEPVETLAGSAAAPSTQEAAEAPKRRRKKSDAAETAPAASAEKPAVPAEKTVDHVVIPPAASEADASVAFNYEALDGKALSPEEAAKVPVKGPDKRYYPASEIVERHAGMADWYAQFADKESAGTERRVSGAAIKVLLAAAAEQRKAE